MSTSLPIVLIIGGILFVGWQFYENIQDNSKTESEGGESSGAEQGGFGMPGILMAVALLFSGLMMTIGLNGLSGMNTEVGYICAACCFGIWARIAQASAHHRQ